MIAFGSRKKIRKEAQDWVLRLDDAHGAEDRAEFERWLARNPAHRTAYDEVLASYEGSSVLRESKIGRRRDLRSAFPERKPVSMRGLAAVSVAGLLLLGAFGLYREMGGYRSVALESVMLSSGAEARSITLADGSKVNLAAQSEVQIDLGKAERVADVRKGRIHLDVAHDSRPFRIVAGTSEAKATDGSFEAALVAGQGSVERSQSQVSETGPDRVLPTVAGKASVPAVMEFRAEPLASAIQRINQTHSGPPLELDPSLAGLRVTAVFQQGTSEDIARSLALAFGLKLTSTQSGSLKLTREK